MVVNCSPVGYASLRTVHNHLSKSGDLSLRKSGESKLRKNGGFIFAIYIRTLKRLLFIRMSTSITSPFDNLQFNEEKNENAEGFY